MLQFAHVEYSMGTKSLDIFSIGCDGCCQDCCNPEIKDWSLTGQDAQQVVEKIKQLNNKFGNLIDKLVLVGGDPVDCYLHYSKEYIEFVKEIKSLNKPIYLFTRYELDQIPEELKIVDFIKTGAYIPKLKCDNNIQKGFKLATSNQRIWEKGKDYA